MKGQCGREQSLKGERLAKCNSKKILIKLYLALKQTLGNFASAEGEN